MCTACIPATPSGVAPRARSSHGPTPTHPPPSCLLLCSELPNRAFWGDVNDLVVDGLLFVASGFRKPARGARKGGLTSMGKATQDSSPLFSASFGNGNSAAAAEDPANVGSKPVAFGEL